MEPTDNKHDEDAALPQAGISDEIYKCILSITPFYDINHEDFPANTSLHEILNKHSTIKHFRRGDLIIREGDYGDSVYCILDGTVSRIIYPGLPESILGHKQRKKKRRFREININSGLERRKDNSNNKHNPITLRLNDEDQTTQYIEDLDAILAKHETKNLGCGEIFGEIGVLSRRPRSISIIAYADVMLLELSWQGLRELRKWSPDFRNYIDLRYRERSLLSHLLENDFFKSLPEENLQKVVSTTDFETHGDFEWYTPFKNSMEKGDRAIIDQEPVIVREGEYQECLILVRSGFARISMKMNNGEKTINFLRSGDMFGLDSIIRNIVHDEPLAWHYTLRAVGYVDILRIPIHVLKTHVLPLLSPTQVDALVNQAPHAIHLQHKLKKLVDFETGMLEFIVENRIMNGTSTMWIDLNRCTRCDDCVRACAANHDDQPRFIRHGKQHAHYMVANACMHCADPVCMIGCPTGAIHRDEQDGQVLINEATCIGCATCANSCPYNNISIHELKDKQGLTVYNESTKRAVLKASKCDLCIGLSNSPACQQACPHDALLRIDSRDTDKLFSWFYR